MSVFEHRTVTIATGQSLSDPFLMEYDKIVGFCLPANIDGATSLTFQTQDPVTGAYANLYDNAGAEVTISIAAGRHVSSDTISSALAPWKYIKIRLGTSTTPVVATADRKITVVMKE